MWLVCANRVANYINKKKYITKSCLLSSLPHLEFLSLRYSVIFLSPTSTILTNDSLHTLNPPNAINNSLFSIEFLLESFSYYYICYS